MKPNNSPFQKSILMSINHLSLVGRLTLNLASLNNEGSEGNATQPRAATIVLDGQLYSVPVISGDMLKYWHASHLSAIAQDRGLPLSQNSAQRNPNPNRIKSELSSQEWVNANMAKTSKLNGEIKGEKRKPIEEELYQVVARDCAVTDAHGILVTELNTVNKKTKEGVKATVAIARTSRVQVGFMTGVPDLSATRHYFHAKFVTERTGDAAREGSGNEGQNIFTRPATSADYAIVITVDLAGLGFDDAGNDYVIPESDRTARKRAVLDALSYTLMNQPGANASQQFPHVMGFKGAIVTSENRLPAPTVSPIKSDYLEQLNRLVDSTNNMVDENHLTMHRVESIADAVDKLSEIGKSYA